MAYRSDTNNRELPNTWSETVLRGELDGYDRGLEATFDGEISRLEKDLSGLEVEITEVNSPYRNKVKILYSLEDQQQIYDSLR